jgi:hypothetical protein
MASKQGDSGGASDKRRFFKAAKTGDTKILAAALAEGIDVQCVDANKWTALHEACRWGQLEAVGVLLAAGADPNAMHPENGFTPLVVACFIPGHGAIARLLLQGGAAPSLASPQGMTPLVAAAGAADLDALEILLEAGADPRPVSDPNAEKLLACVQELAARERLRALVDQFAAKPRQTLDEARRAAAATRRPAAPEPYVEPTPLSLDQLQVKGAARPVPQASLEKLKQHLATALPAGYEELMRTVGPGTLRGAVRVYGPQTLMRETQLWRERIARYWFWGDGPLLAKKAAQGATRIADTLDGDELVFLPTQPDTLFLLPREEQVVRLASKTGLLAALARLVAGDSGRVPRKLPYEPTDEMA